MPTLLLLVLGAGGCGKQIGADCAVTGSGFQRSDDCAGWCMQHWPVRCASGESQMRAHCSGAVRCEGAGCDRGQVCYLGTNSFAVCLPEDWCDGWNPVDLR